MFEHTFGARFWETITKEHLPTVLNFKRTLSRDLTVPMHAFERHNARFRET
jgi:hypothetical protein